MTLFTYPVGGLQTNCYLLADDAGDAVLIDPGAEAPRLLRAISENGLHLRAILLTHAHCDHTGAVAAIQAATAAPLLLHEADAPMLADADSSLYTMFELPFTPLTAARLLRDGETFSVGGLTFTVLHTPGHTPGSSCYRCGDALLCGDTLFAGSIGRTDFIGGNPAQLADSLTKLAALTGDCRVLPGHGEATTLAWEQKHNPFLRRL